MSDAQLDEIVHGYKTGRIKHIQWKSFDDADQFKQLRSIVDTAATTLREMGSCIMRSTALDESQPHVMTLDPPLVIETAFDILRSRRSASCVHAQHLVQLIAERLCVNAANTHVQTFVNILKTTDRVLVKFVGDHLVVGLKE